MAQFEIQKHFLEFKLGFQIFKAINYILIICDSNNIKS